MYRFGVQNLTRVEDQTVNGRPTNTSTAKTIRAIEQLLRQLNRLLKILKIATQFDLPKTIMHQHVFHQKLNFSKVCAR